MISIFSFVLIFTLLASAEQSARAPQPQKTLTLSSLRTNVQTAKTLGLTIPRKVLTWADRVIQ